MPDYLSAAGAGRLFSMALRRSKVREDEEGLVLSGSAAFASSIDEYFLFPIASITYAVLRRRRSEDAELRIEDDGSPSCPPGEYAERCCPHKHCREYSIDPIANSVFSCSAIKCIYSLDRFSFIAGVYKDEDGLVLEGSFSLDLQLDAFLL